MNARKLGFYFDSNPALQTLVREAARLAELQRVFSEIAPQPCARSGKVGRLTHGSLLLFADNGASAAKLRQLEPSLLIKFQQRGCDVTAIRIEVQPRNSHNFVAAPQKNPGLSPQAAQYLQDLAGGLPAGELRAALEKMAARSLNNNDEPFKHEQPQHQDRQHHKKPE
ncbi:MAG: DciA family protein [Burkholderiales bacterium]